MRRCFIEFFENPHDLGKLFHQMRLVLQPPCRVDQQNIRSLLLRLLQRVIGEPRGVGTDVARHNWGTSALSPNGELVNCRCPERVARGDDHFLAGLRELMRELADCGGLARTIHTDNENDMGFVPVIKFQRPRHGLQHLGHLRPQYRAHLFRRDFLVVAPYRYFLGDANRHINAEIGLDERVLKLLQSLIIKLALGKDRRDVFGELVGRLAQAVPQPREPAFLFRFWFRPRFRYCLGFRLRLRF